MATSVYFNGKMRTLPGVYSTITSGESSGSRNLDYGTVLLIDTGVYGAGYGGGSGVNGVNAQGKDAIYEFNDLQSFREFVKGGMFWKCAEALFKPDPLNAEAVGISKLLYARACQTTPAIMTFSPVGGGSSGGNLIIKTVDEGLNANGITDGDNLKTGYAWTIEAGTENSTSFIMRFWQSTYRGLYKDPVTGLEASYDENPLTQATPLLIAETPEFTTLQQVVGWCNSDENFRSRFRLDETSTIIGNGSVDESDITDNIGLNLFTGGTEQYRPNDLDDLLTQASDVDYNISFTDIIGEQASGSAIDKVVAHRNDGSKFDKFVYVGAHGTKARFNDSLIISRRFNNPYVCVVHGGTGTASDLTANETRWWGVFYTLCSVIGRVSGKPPYIPVTNKSIGGDKLQHIPDEHEQKKALDAGLLVVYPNPYLNRFVVLQGINTLQDNKVLFNRSGQSFSIQFMRIIAQLNKECVVNAEIDLMGDENGVNLNTLSKGALETWTINFLQSRVATQNQDNLIVRFQNVVATRVEDYYKVTYEVLVNNEITKIFFTGFLLKN